MYLIFALLNQAQGVNQACEFCEGDSMQIKIISGKELENYIADLARLRISVFREYPYLFWLKKL